MNGIGGFPVGFCFSFSLCLFSSLLFALPPLTHSEHVNFLGRVPGSENIVIVSVLHREQEKGYYRGLRHHYDVCRAQLVVVFCFGDCVSHEFVIILFSLLFIIFPLVTLVALFA
jgi:hypothetical protein